MPGTDFTKPVDVGELLNYQEGAVVSRTIVDKPAGTVTLFAFGKGEGLSEHEAPFDALVWVVDGEIEVTVAGVSHNLTAGRMIVMPAHSPHAVRATQNAKMLLTMIRSTE